MTERKAGPHSGKRLNQKLKPYVVLQYLLKNTDENMVSSAQDIVAILKNAGLMRNGARFIGISRTSTLLR